MRKIGMAFSTDVLTLDCDRECQSIVRFIRQQVFQSFKRKGGIIGLSGGIDSAVVAALAVRAIGANRVFALLLPEKESNPQSVKYAELLADQLGIRRLIVDITPILTAFGVYRNREMIVKKNFPDFDTSWKFRLVMPQHLLEEDRLNISSLEVRTPSSEISSKRLSSDDYLGMTAATAIKQRTRMTMLYYHAERMNYLVIGTTNVPERLQGFFVKQGDGGVDIEPIAHLYKTQVYQLARFLDIPREIIDRIPSPDTYSYEVSDQEFYFRLPYEMLDLLLYAQENNIGIQDIQRTLNISEEQIERVFRDFNAKRRATEHLRNLPPSLVEGDRDQHLVRKMGGER